MTEKEFQETKDWLEHDARWWHFVLLAIWKCRGNWYYLVAAAILIGMIYGGIKAL